jgi:hypothetical protein
MLTLRLLVLIEVALVASVPLTTTVGPATTTARFSTSAPQTTSIPGLWNEPEIPLPYVQIRNSQNRCFNTKIATCADTSHQWQVRPLNALNNSILIVEFEHGLVPDSKRVHSYPSTVPNKLPAPPGSQRNAGPVESTPQQ